MSRIRQPGDPDKPTITGLQLAILRAVATDPSPLTTEAAIAELAALGKAEQAILADALRSPNVSLDSAAEIADRASRYFDAIFDLVTTTPRAAPAKAA